MSSPLCQGLASAVLDAALEAIAGAAFVVGPRGRVVRANAVARRQLERGGARVRAEVRRATPVGTFTVHDSSTYGIVVLPTAPGDVSSRVTAATVRWRLTPLEQRVLTLVAEGVGTRTVAERLALSARTVEGVVSALLRKSGAERRAELVARV